MEKKKHGGQQKSACAEYNHPIFVTYRHMVRRCYNNKTRSHKNYEGKGIKVCEEWLNDKDKFFQWATNNGWVKGLTIDRIDADKDYSPENCRWLTLSENSRLKMSKRRGELAHNRLLTEDHVRVIRLLYNKLSFSAYEIAGFLGVSTGSVYDIVKNKYWVDVK